MKVISLDTTGNRPYVSAVIADGPFVFVSGQTPTRNGILIRGTVEQQTDAALENIAQVLQAAGATMDDVVKCGVYLSDLADLPKFNDAYVRAFGARLPARTTVGVDLPGYAVEIDCIAALPGN